MRFPVRKSLFVKILVICFCGLSLFTVYYYTHPSLMVLMLSILLLWIYFSTEYKISKDYFSYRSGPFSGKIFLEDIKAVKAEENWFYIGWKVALSARNGLLIRYNKFDEIFIAPEDKDGFIELLLQRNPKIVVDKNNDSAKEPIK